MEPVEQSRQQNSTKDSWSGGQIQQKQDELDTAVRERGDVETEMRRQIAGLECDISKQRRENQRVTQAKDEVTRENEALSNEVTDLRQNVGRLETLLRTADVAMTEMRQRLRQSEEVLIIPSRDINLTSRKLGHGSYGG